MYRALYKPSYHYFNSTYNCSTIFSLTSIPIQELIELLNNELKEHKIDECDGVITKKDIIKGIQLTLSENYFTYNNNWFRQRDGLGMGFKLSPILAKFYLKNFFKLTESFDEKPNFLNIYVDDCFTFWNKEYDFNNYVKKLNDLRPNNMKFTIESEIDRKLSFLDLLLMRKDNEIILDIYRKPTNKNRFLNYSSNHSINAKIAVADSQIRRAMILRGTLYEKEIKKVKEILISNDYPINFINSRISRLTNKRLLKNRNNTNDFDINKVITIPYFKGVSESIGKVLKSYGLNVTYSRLRNSFESMIYNNKDKTPNSMKAGVYRIDCETCGKTYIGETKRYLKCRITEHKGYVKNKNIKISPLAEHCLENNHNINWNNAKIIKTSRSCSERQLDEALIIRGFDETSILNRDKGKYIDIIWSAVIEKRA